MSHLQLHGSVCQFRKSSSPKRRAWPGATTEVTSTDALEKLRFWQQGNEDLYTMHNLSTRELLREDARIVDVLEDWWQAAVSGSLVVHRPVLDENGDAMLPYPVYVDILMRIELALLEEGEHMDFDEAQRLAHDAWVQDAGGEHEYYLEQDAWEDSLFELADLWSMQLWLTAPCHYTCMRPYRVSGSSPVLLALMLAQRVALMPRNMWPSWVSLSRRWQRPSYRKGRRHLHGRHLGLHKLRHPRARLSRNSTILCAGLALTMIMRTRGRPA